MRLEEIIKRLKTHKKRIEKEEIKDYLCRLKRIDTSISRELYDSNDIQSTFLLEGKKVDSLATINQYMNHNPQLQKDYLILKLL